MLRHGANPDLRDEDGKTPLDKARERNDEGHREVAAILQSPGNYFYFDYCIHYITMHQCINLLFYKLINK